MQIAICAAAVLVVMAVLWYMLYSKEGFMPKLDYKTDNVGGLFLTEDRAYLPYPSGELVISPLYNAPKTVQSLPKPYDLFTDLPVGRFQKGFLDAAFTPDTAWCADIKARDIYHLNAGQLILNTGGKMFVSLNPSRHDKKVMKTAAYLFMNPDGSVCASKVMIIDGKRTPSQQVCYNIQDQEGIAYQIQKIGLDKQGRFQVFALNDTLYPLRYSKVDMPFSPCNDTEAKEVDLSKGIPYATLLDDCTFAVFDGEGNFQYRACL